METTRSVSFARFFFYALMVDALFLPFLLPIPLPISLGLVPIWFFCVDPRVDKRTSVLCAIGVLLAILAFMYGAGGQSLVLQSLAFPKLVNAAMLLIMFTTYYLAMNTEFRSDNYIAALLRGAVVFNFAFACLYILNPFLYFDLRKLWSFGQEVEIGSVVDSTTRFTGILSDPNNLAVAISAITATLVTYRNNSLANIALLAMTGIIVIATMSATGTVCFAIIVATYILGSKVQPLGKLSIALVAAVIGYFAYTLIKDTQVFSIAMDRVAQSDVDSRFSRWQIAYDSEKWLSSLLVGDGGVVLWGDQEFKPHNGHLHLIFAFGLPLYIVFMMVFFQARPGADWRRHIPMLILFIGFTINVGIYEHRFALILVIVMLLYHRVSSHPVSTPRQAHREPSGPLIAA